MQHPQHQLQPQQPVYVMRGHASPIHALHFYRSNHRLISADADGWVVVWNVQIRRPVAVWKAHESAILGVTDWDDSNIVTHGRDNKIYVWRIRHEDEGSLDRALPVETTESPRRNPWLLQSLDVNSLNFCAFASCQEEEVERDRDSTSSAIKAVRIAVPSSRDPNTIDIYSLPSTDREHVGVGSRLGFKTGMPMALKLLYVNAQLTLIAGFESGHAVVFSLDPSAKSWITTYSARPHTQPVLSLDFYLPSISFYTSSADALIVKHPIPTSREDSPTPIQVVDTHHAGQQSLISRSDGKIIATAGWDSRIRVYSFKSAKEVAVLKWHREGCYAVTFAKIFGSEKQSGSEVRDHTKDMLQRIATSEAIQTIGQQRDDRTRRSHWLAAGSKDGRISLWEVF